MLWSFSRVNSFKQCPYAWLKQYVFSEKRLGGYYGEYGGYLHTILEKYFKGELELFELPSYYTENYDENVITTPPPKPVDLAEKYFAEGLKFFEEFEFDHAKYEILGVEKEVSFYVGKYKFTGYIDLLMKDKTTEEIIIVDYKSSDPYKGAKTPIKAKIDEYKKQQYLYAYALFKEMGFYPPKMQLWFVRFNKVHEIQFDEMECMQTLSWAEGEIDSILAESDFKPLSSFWFCNYLCSVRNGCEFRINVKGA
jgi:RecB family exonuclease